jgi:hypothetical protein
VITSLTHIDRAIASLVLKITYGHMTDGKYDFLLMGKRVADIAEEAMSGLYLVDWFTWCKLFLSESLSPILTIPPPVKYVPSWVPGAKFQRQAALWKEELRSNINIPFDFVKKLNVRARLSTIDGDILNSSTRKPDMPVVP